VFLGCAMAAALVPFPGSAQPRFGQPIFPAYQGFVENADGSVTMVFQYFSHGRDPVEIPVGEQNGFTGVADRNQPTTFLPGNHEFVCVIVAESPEAAKAVRWGIAFPKDPIQTSADPLNSEYRLMERAQEEANRAVDLATAPRGVCLNKPPRVVTNTRRAVSVEGSSERGIEEIPAKLGQPLALTGSVEDEGLPRGSSVTSTWRQTSGPGKATFEDASSPRTKVTFDAPGTYELELHATDGALEHAERIRVAVAPAG
jgi:hypothetical protein